MDGTKVLLVPIVPKVPMVPSPSFILPRVAGEEKGGGFEQLERNYSSIRSGDAFPFSMS
jgi:hypothetical protein